MSVYKKLKEDIKEAMKGKDSFTLTILRSLDSSIQLKAKESKVEITDDLVYEMAKKARKVVNEEIENARKYSYNETMKEKLKEKIIVNQYIPNELSKEETENVVDKIIKSVEATSIKDMGKVMGMLKKEYGDKINMGIASGIVKLRLGG